MQRMLRVARRITITRSARQAPKYHTVLRFTTIKEGHEWTRVNKEMRPCGESTVKVREHEEA